MNDPFERWAASRGGFFTRAEAKDYGYSDTQIQAATRDGVWIRLRHGYYATGEYVGRLDATGRHRLLAQSVLHRLGPGYVLVGPSACAMHDIALWDADLDVVRVARLGGRPGRREAGIRFQNQAIDDSQIVIVGGSPVVSPARAVWEASCELGTEGALVCMNSALHSGAVDRSALEALDPDFSRWRGSRTARLAYRMADPRVETVGETRTMFLCWQAHLPRPQPQFEIVSEYGELIARTDFAWREDRHVCEFDGKVKYVRYLRPGESTSDAVLREKRREDLVRAERFGMSRLTWTDLEGQARRARTVLALRRGIEQSRRLYARNRTVIV